MDGRLDADRLETHGQHHITRWSILAGGQMEPPKILRGLGTHTACEGQRVGVVSRFGFLAPDAEVLGDANDAVLPEVWAGLPEREQIAARRSLSCPLGLARCPAHVAPRSATRGRAVCVALWFPVREQAGA